MVYGMRRSKDGSTYRVKIFFTIFFLLLITTYNFFYWIYLVFFCLPDFEVNLFLKPNQNFFFVENEMSHFKIFFFLNYQTNWVTPRIIHQFFYHFDWINCWARLSSNWMWILNLMFVLFCSKKKKTGWMVKQQKTRLRNSWMGWWGNLQRPMEG